MDAPRKGQSIVRLAGSTNVLIFSVTSLATFGVLVAVAFLGGGTSKTPVAKPATAAAPEKAPTKLASTKPKPATALGVGTLIGAKDCQWGPSEMPTEQHSRLVPGKLTLSKGVAEIRLDQGAVLILEGPAVFEVRTKNSAFLHKGKLVAHVPKRAQGFQLQTPAANIIDLGLENSVQTITDEDRELFQLGPGESLQVPSEDSSGTIRLGPGESQRLSPGGKIEAGKSNLKPEDFPRFDSPPEPAKDKTI